MALTYASGVPVVKVGRIAGQFAKPRSSEPETQVGDVTLESFRGHIVNDEPSPSRPPARPRAAAHGVPPDRGHLEPAARVHQGRVRRPVARPRLEPGVRRRVARGTPLRRLADDIERAVRFMRACGIDLARESSLHSVDFYTSHEALVLPYEEALTRRDSLTGDYYDCSAHMVWIGDRTRESTAPTSSSASGIDNPIG